MAIGSYDISRVFTLFGAARVDALRGHWSSVQLCILGFWDTLHKHLGPHNPLTLATAWKRHRMCERLWRIPK